MILEWEQWVDEGGLQGAKHLVRLKQICNGPVYVLGIRQFSSWGSSSVVFSFSCRFYFLSLQ